MKKSALLLLILIASNCTSVFGWGQKGHNIVTYIAEKNLNCKAKRNIDKILEGRSIVYYSTWMDNLQNSPQWIGHYDATETWHYANINDEGIYDPANRPESGDVISALAIITESLRDKNQTDSVRLDNLLMLIHLVGDIHCPMHAGRLSDRGGNDIEVYWFGTKTNLHSVWDSKLLESANLWSYTEWQEQLDRYTRKEKKEIMAGAPEDWYAGTLMTTAKVYANATPGQRLSYQYVYDNKAMVEQQLLYAGYRLAALLNDIFG